MPIQYLQTREQSADLLRLVIAVIHTVAQLLKRVADGPGLAVARVGDEEFAILMARSTQAKAAQLAQVVLSLVRATKIRNRANQEVITTVTVSAGVAVHVKGDDAYGLIGAADAALYRSKQSGRDRVTVA